MARIPELRRLVAIVEGQGEVAAAPILLRRIINELLPPRGVEIVRPIRIPKGRLLRPGELERAVRLAALRSSRSDGILILLDADDDCPKDLAPQLLERAAQARPDRRVRVVLATCEYESWFLASAAALAGRRGLREDLPVPADPESIRDAKGWLSRHMTGGRAYRETLDQPALTDALDLVAARLAPSFDKLWRDVAGLAES